MMTKKALIIVGLAAVLAASTGVVFATNSNTHQRGADGDPEIAVTGSTSSAADPSGDDNYSVESTLNSSDIDDTSYIEETTASADITQSDVTEQNQTSDDGDSSFQVAPSASYSIVRVIERESGEEQSPQLVFGKYFSSCYLTLYNDCTAEICLSPSTGKSEKGTYSIYGNTMYVDFGDDRMAEYSVVFGDNSSISYIIVGSGEYDVYFG